MDEVYKGYRIAIKAMDTGWRARVQEPRGRVLPVSARSTMAEGAETCLKRSREAVDRYLRYLSGHCEHEGQ